MSDAEPAILPDAIKAVLDRCVDDPSAVFDEDALRAAVDLALTDQRLYQRYLVECKELGVAMRDLRADLKERIRAARDARQGEESESSALGKMFAYKSSGLFQRVQSAAGSHLVRLSNFRARIIAETIVDDGVEEQRHYEIDATVNGGTLHLRVPASEFGSMTWVHRLGVRAIVLPGPGTRDALRAAIQTYSSGRCVRRAYGHTGWRRREDGSWAYLHAGGAVVAEALIDPETEAAAPQSGPGAEGQTPTEASAGDQTPTSSGSAAADEQATTPDRSPTAAPAQQPRVLVDLPSQLRRYALPEPPVGDARREAIRAVLRMMTLCPRVLYPLVAFAHRAALGCVDFAIWLMGPTGCFKSEVAVLISQLWGQQHDRRHLPLSWTATPTAMETLLFAAKDTIVVIDDFVPRGSAMERDRLHATAERVLRSLGNGSTRARGTASGGLRPDHPPRASVIVTAEDAPRGHSARARSLLLELTHGDIEPAALSERQAAGSSGAYAQAMSGYLLWIGERLVAGRPPRLGERARELRDLAASDQMHRRTPGIAADLGVGLELFLAHALDAGAINAIERDAIWTEGWAAIGAAAGAQQEYQVEEEPASTYLRLLASAVATGRAHLCSTTGGEPAQARLWGWRPVQVGDKEVMRPGGDQVGWVGLGGAQVYLEPDAAYRAVQAYAPDGHGLPVSQATLRRRLHERGLLASTETRGGKTHLTVRRVLSGVRREVLHIKWPAVGGADEPTKTTNASESTGEAMQMDMFDMPGGTT
ncbi:MAG: DUF927 domain-containing protein [Planctomycetota bacterium]|nr:DUF927 domain-containing protein [Planctomycetota bacterium]